MVDNTKIPEHERIVLFTTLDNCLIRREECRRVAEAFRQFGGETSLDAQAVILERAAMDYHITAIGWNQTSVCSENWANAGGYNSKTGEDIPYNCFTGTKHYWLFDEMVLVLHKKM